MPSRVSVVLFLSCLFSLWSPETQGSETPEDQRLNGRMMQMPAISATQIAFCYGGDLWLLPKTGGVAMRLSSPHGAESFPRFSPDGTQLAFTANYEGNDDVYVMPVAGGSPKRITHHGAPERVLGWYPDGKSILFASKMASFTDRVGQFYKVNATGGLPEKLPPAYGEFGAISPDGGLLAFTTATTDFSSWKRYRGGMAPEIWLYDLVKGTAENVTQNDASDSLAHHDALRAYRGRQESRIGIRRATPLGEMF